MRYGSLFSGYGGLDAGVQSILGGSTAWHVEFDKAPSAILAHHWPDVPNYGDITAVDFRDVEPVDVLTGGFPCQDVSHAGRRAGLIRNGDGRTRSGLWGHMLRAIDELRPSLVVAENVRGLLSARADSDVEPCPWCVGDGEGEPHLRALGAVLADLADVGYDAAWYGLRAADVGAAHGRFRVFIFATPAEPSNLGLEWAGASRDGWHGPTDSGAPALTLLPTPSVADGMGGHLSRSGARSDELLLPGVAKKLGEERLLPTPTTTQRGTDANLDTREGARANLHNEVVNLLPTPRADEGGGNGEAEALRHSPGLSNIRTHFPEATRWGDYAPAIARWERVIGRPAPDPTEPGPKGNPRLSPAFVEWLMGLPEGHVTDVPGLTRNNQLKALGNGVVPQQAAAATAAWVNDFARSAA